MSSLQVDVIDKVFDKLPHKRLLSKPVIERVQALADISRSGYIVIVTQPMHQLYIRPTVHN